VRPHAAYRQVSILVACLSLALAGCSGSEKSSSKAAKARPVDGTTLFNSVAAAFIARYNPAGGDRPKVSNDRTFCTDDDKPVWVCNVKVKLLLGVTEDWVYNVRVDGRCWTAVTRDKYGANQDSVDAYRNREMLAPGRREVARLVKDAKRLRRLRGCAETTTTRRDPTAFLAQYISQSVSREAPASRQARPASHMARARLH
jgi:hypothetical protein